MFSVVFDAGSTGSRVHVFDFTSEHGELVLNKDTFEQLKPGLGDAGWAADPQAAAASLQPLLDTALATVPPELQAATPVELRATAGLRLLPGNQADAILEAVRGLLLTTPFKLAADGVTIMDGADEGAFAWMTLNYLLGKTGEPAHELVGAIDLGGGSVQQAFAVDEATAANAVPGAPLCRSPVVRRAADCIRQCLAFSYQPRHRPLTCCRLLTTKGFDQVQATVSRWSAAGYIRHLIMCALAFCDHNLSLHDAGSAAGYIRPMSGGGQTYNVYVHSYLGFGLHVAFAKQPQPLCCRIHPASNYVCAGVLFIKVMALLQDTSGPCPAGGKPTTCTCTRTSGSG